MTEAGVSRADVAKRLAIPVETVDDWLSGDSQPTTTQFRKLAEYLKRSTAALLLPAPPQQGTPASFRHPPGAQHTRTTTPAEAEQVRAARRVQRIAQWIDERTESGDGKPIPAVPTSVAPAEAAKTLSAWLGWSTERQRNAKDKYAALRELRDALEERHVLVLHLSLGREGARGFSIAGSTWPVIAVNRSYIPEARMFTYIHELAHLASNTESMCVSGGLSGSELERWCEAVAGNVLLPDDVARAAVRELGVEQVTTVAEVESIARRFRLSLRGTAYRLQLAGLGAANLYARVNAATDWPAPRDDGTGPREKSAVKRHREYGAAFSSLLLAAESERLVSSHDVIEYLGLPANQLDEWRSLASRAA